MAVCGITRTEKKKRQDLPGIHAENNRCAADEGTRNFTSKIDWSMTDQNVMLKKSDDWIKDINILLSEKKLKKLRKDAVFALDTIYTANQEFFDGKSRQEIINFFLDCLEYHKKELCGGNEDQIINAVIHFDETTPHMHIISVPLIQEGEKWRLSAKDLMGNKKTYQIRQDHFYEQISRKYGLDRGEPRQTGEKIKKHKEQAAWHLEQLDKSIKQKEIQSEELDEFNRSMEISARQLQSKVDKLKADKEQLIRDVLALQKQKSHLRDDLFVLMIEFDDLRRKQNTLTEDYLMTFPEDREQASRALKSVNKELDRKQEEITRNIEETARLDHELEQKYNAIRDEEEDERDI